MMLLQANHPFLVDGLNSGFRAPDWGWVGTPRDTPLVAGHFSNGRGVYAHFWAAPSQVAQSLAQSAARDLQAWMSACSASDRPDEDVPVASVCLWENATGGWSLVGIQSLTDDFDDVQDGAGLGAHDLTFLMECDATVVLLATGTSDHTPPSLAGRVGTIRHHRRGLPQDTHDAILELLVSASLPVCHEYILTHRMPVYVLG